MTLLIFAASISAVSAFDFSDIFGSENETVTIEGIDFNVPAGFEEDPTNATNDAVSQFVDEGLNVTAKTYLKGPSEISIWVSNYTAMGQEGIDISTGNGEATTINGVDGYLKKDGEAQLFTFDKDGCFVIMSATDEDIIGDFLIA